MSNMNYLTLGLTQATDSNALNSNSSNSEEEGSLVFSDMIKEYEMSGQGGNNAAETGNIDKNKVIDKNQVIRNKESEGSDNTVALDNSTDITDDTSYSLEESEGATAEVNEESLMTVVSSDKTVDESQTLESTTEVIQVVQPNTEVASTNPEELLSFLTASEQVLSGNKNQLSNNEDPVVTQDELKNNSSLTLQTTSASQNFDAMTLQNHLSSSVEGLTTEDFAGEELTLTTDKAALAQVLLKQTETDEVASRKNTLKTEAELAVVANKPLVGEALSPQTDTDEVAALNKVNEAIDSKNLQNINLSNSGAKAVPTEVVQSTAGVIDVQSELSDAIGTITESAELLVEGESLEAEALSNEKVIPLVLPKQTSTKESMLEQASLKDTEIKAGAIPLNEESTEVINEDIELLNLVKSDVKENQVKAVNPMVMKAEPLGTEKLTSEITVDDLSEADAEVVIDELLSAETDLKSSSSVFNNLLATSQREIGVNPFLDTSSQSDMLETLDGSSQDENSFENVMQSLSSDLSQTQKNTLTQQIETISIMRKDFSDAVKDKIMVMINQKIQQIDIQLDPPELGSMQVRVNMQNDQAVVSFVVQNQQAKEALEQNLDRLKHMMADSGVDVGDTNVKQESNQSSMNGEGQHAFTGQGEDMEEVPLENIMSSEQAKVLKASSTGVDYYA